MTEEEIKQATCQVLGKDESGTGWLIGPQVVLTAYHCIRAELLAREPVRVRFGASQCATEHAAIIGANDEELDVCLLQLPAPLEFDSVPISTEALRPGEKWSAFGYPVTKLQLGHAIRGEIQQVLAERVHGVDLDLSVDPGTHLSDYAGLSGSAFIVSGVCKGMLRLSVDSALGALSFEKLRPFLEDNALVPGELTADNEGVAIGSRPQFDELFEETLKSKRSGYVFLDGSHGVGKSTYCEAFSPQSQALEGLGVYHFTDRGRGSAPAQQVQPETFFDWVNSLLSNRATGKPARLMDLTYGRLIEMTNEVFKSLAARSQKAGKTGVVFIDGINEAAAAGDDSLRRFVNLLPPQVPEGLVIVVTGVGLDSIAASLAPILQSAERLTLPALERDVQYGVCRSFLDQGKAGSAIVNALCDRALGHPLYLRYLADLVNSGATAGDISELPVFSGAIEDYYETIWAKLLPNNDVTNLLGIIARFRWGIALNDLTGALTSAEMVVLPSTLQRVRHLLESPENTAIYHPSFSQFVIHKTALIDQWVHTRLADFCRSNVSGEYGVLNQVHHALRGGEPQRRKAIESCQQTWVDDSVLRGAEPDLLLSDIDETLQVATAIGGAVDIIRLLLLSQRLTFRYNILFVQSAQLVASALIALGRPESALRHVIRNGRLVVAVDEAFSLANAFTQHGSPSLTLEILELVHRDVNAVFEKIRSEGGISRREFFSAVDLRLHAFSLAKAAGDEPPFISVLRFVAEGVLRAPNSEFSPEQQAEVLRNYFGLMTGAELCLLDKFRPLSELGVPVDKDLRHQLLSLLQTLLHGQMYSELYGKPLDRSMVALLLTDVARVIDAPLESDDRHYFYIDALIEAGAAPGLVKTYSAGVDLGSGSLPLHKENRADPDEAGFERAMLSLRAAAFLEDSHSEPAVPALQVGDWERALESLARAVAWCDGKSRKASAAKDESSLKTLWSFLESKLLPCLAFPLEERIYWDSSYFIPETVVPRLYQQLAKLVADCFPARLAVLLDALEQGFRGQLGLYNEGFRKALQQALRVLIERRPGGELADKVFSLVLRWRDYVAANVENRFELVPELLQIVPLLARLDAGEEALRTYQMILSNSMGPSWYKEDQLSMMSSTLEALPADSAVQGSSLAQIAALLERATGEMTFQRYVRADKGVFIGQLCRHSLFAEAVRYFQHQSCGTRQELYDQATSGNLDRVSTLVGMRFPGAALEEQAALLALLRNVGSKADWQLRWALLEAYQNGDERHLTDWGSQYANIISELAGSPEDLEAADARVRSIAAALNAERAWMLLRSLVSGLAPELRSRFEADLDRARSKLDAEQVQQLGASFGLTLGEGEVQKADAGSQKQASDNEEPDDYDNRFILPGTFGKRSAVDDSNAQLGTAREHLKRRNYTAATEECIKALRTLQAAGWSIWSDNHSGRFADELIKTHVQSADEVARLYGPLALEERHTQRWSIASHLISLVAQKADANQQAAILAIAIDHVAQIVGEASAAQFTYIGKSTNSSASEAVLELLLWTLDHPVWVRRDAAASMVLWLARRGGTCLPQLAKLAVSMDSRNRADIAAAILDILSRENAANLWQHIESRIDVAEVVSQCRHVGRLVTFMRIAERAARRGIESGAAAFKAIADQFPENTALPAPAPDLGPPRYVPPTLYLAWHELAKLGVLSSGVNDAFASQMASVCAPLSVPVARELEALVAQSGRENPDFATGRWAATVRYALNTAVFQIMPATKLKKVEAVLRMYNPESLWEPEDGVDLLASLVASLQNAKERRYMPSHADLVFLDLQCVMELKRGHPAHVEVTAHLVPPGQQLPGKPAPPSFKATELPHPGASEPLAVCGRAEPTLAYFGCLSPAIATPRFLQLVAAQASDMIRYHWRHGSTASTLSSSRRHEAALLAMERSAFALPAGWQMQWILRVDGDVRAVLSKA